MNNPQGLVGLKVHRCLGFRLDKSKKNPEMSVILFDDMKTIMAFEEQDYYSYHDCSDSARIMGLVQDEVLWAKVNADQDHYVDTDNHFGDGYVLL